jgi:malonate transporter
MPGAAPHKTFNAQSIADRAFGSAGLSLAALATAILVLITNLVIVPLMVFLNWGEQQGSIKRAVLCDLPCKPLLLSVQGGRQ